MIEDIITPAQCRAARALLNITQAQLAQWSRVSKPTIADFERGERASHYRTLRDLRTAFEMRGVRFSFESDGRTGVSHLEPPAESPDALR